MSEQGQRNPVIVFFGWVLMGIGGLIAATAGACSLIFLAQVATAGGGLAGIAGMLGLIAIFGGTPMVVGVGLFIAGRVISRRRVTRPD